MTTTFIHTSNSSEGDLEYVFVEKERHAARIVIVRGKHEMEIELSAEEAAAVARALT